MRTRSAVVKVCVALSGILACATASAVPVTLNFQGSVSSYTGPSLSAALPLGAAVDLSLTFNETFADGSYSFSDNLGPVSGYMTIGSANYTFDGVQPFSYQYSIPSGDVNWVEPMFTGTGPQIGTGDLYGLFALIRPDLTLVSDLFLGYGFTTNYADGFSVTNYGYAYLTADHYSITPVVTSVPEPAPLWLLAMGLLAAAASRRWSRSAR